MTKIRFLPLDLGNALLAGFFQVFFDRLAPHHLPHLVYDEEVRSEFNKWRTTMAMIQAVLSDAEEKEMMNVAVKLWLDNLRDLIYDAEDIFDEYATKTLERNLIPQLQTNLLPTCLSNLSPSVLISNSNMVSNIQGITERLEELCEQRNELGLERIGEGTLNGLWQRPPTTCLPTEAAVYGRDADKAKIIEMVLRDEPSDANFRVISIVGMAGVGKTTLAQQVYHDKALYDFKQRAWVCVSNDFDVFRMSKSILESVTHSSCDLKDLNEVQVQLKAVVAGRRFLLVLDDVWSKNYDLWETLKSPFMAGAPGSRIIVTTRSIDVALTMGPCEYYDLKLLLDDDCWSLFKKHALEKRDIGAQLNVELIREKVVRKCRGLPLAARTLGGLLRSKQRTDEWEDILSNKMWDLPEESNILPVLKLSYYHLPSHLKRCFVYCSILPKNYEFEEKELVLLWMAEGLILPSTNNKQLEDIGGEYFRDLLSRSIFQKSSGDVSKFVMHDLVNDLAQWVSGETSFRLEDELGDNIKSNRFLKARHSSYSSGYFDGKNKFEVYQKVEHLRTFLPILTHDRACFLSNEVVLNLLPKFKKLRVLSLRRYCITELPESIGNLRYLRYLNLSDTEIRCLPQSISLLFNLQILMVRNCLLLIELPSSVETLINLRHFDIKGASLISEMPRGMRELKNLQTLSDFIVSKNTSLRPSLNDLKSLMFLRGELRISGLENVTDLQDFKEAVMSDKKDLQVLILEWGLKFDNTRNAGVEKEVLDILQPHTNLIELTISHYGGIEFPYWLGNLSFCNMVVLKLLGCEKCTSLPSLGVLESLKILTISGMTTLSRIGSEFYGKGCSNPFKSLETFCLENLLEWKHWDPTIDNENVQIFHSLCELSITNCPKLSERLPGHLPSLQKLVIRKCAELVVSFSSVPVLRQWEIDGCRELLNTCAADSWSLSHMNLSNIADFENWLTQGFQKVEHLKIAKCSTLLSFPEACFLPILSVLEIVSCSALRSLRGIMKHDSCLERLVIEGCDSLIFITEGHLPSSVKRLEIRSCANLKGLFDDREDNLTSSSSSSQGLQENTNHINTSLLEYLYISECPSLTFLASRGMVSEAIKHLEVRDCSELTTLISTGQFPETLKHLEIQNCSKLTTLSLGGPLPSSVEHLYIERCPITTLSSTHQLPASLQHLEIQVCSELRTLSGTLPAPLKHLEINTCRNLSSIPEGLQYLSNLHEIKLLSCPGLESFPQGGLPNTNLTVFSINHCENLRALPISLHSLSSLQELHISQCSRIASFPKEGFPTNLTSLSIENFKFYDQLILWGLHKLSSLRNLRISGLPNAVSFPHEGMGIVLPTSLTHLTISNFPKLKNLFPEGFQNLSSLEYLWISNCPILKSFPKDLPSSLLELYISQCDWLKRQCRRNRGREWPKICDIPFIKIDDKFIYELEEEELLNLIQ